MRSAQKAAFLLFLMTITLPLKSQELRAKTFANGLRWLHKPVSHNQIMAFYLYFPYGAAVETEKMTGISSLMTSIMFKGTDRRTSRQIAEEVESLGAYLDADAADDTWELDGQ